MIARFKDKMRDNGQSFKWFHREFIKKHGISYVQFIQQLNDFSPLKDEVKKEIIKYLGA